MQKQMQLKFQKLNPDAKIPTRGTDGAAGYDLYLAEDLVLPTSFEEVRMARFGIAVEIPKGFVGILTERSSTHTLQLSQANKIGIIDCDYRGELKAPYSCRENWTEGEYLYTDENDCAVNGRIYPKGSRVAQLVIVPCFMGTPVEVDCLTNTERGEGGFGSTGT